MKSTRLIIILLVTLAVTFFAVSSALAGGWQVIGATHNPDAGNWGDPGQTASGQVPHLGLSSSTNQCRTCHAVHNADNTSTGTEISDLGDGSAGSGNSFKLLRNESRQTECYFCHGETGALSDPVKKPYAPLEDEAGDPIATLGEHTLGATVVPDSTVDSSFLSSTGGLSCGNCHSVHGSWTLNDVSDVTGADAGELGTRILRRDPAQNGNGSTGKGAAGGVVNVADQGAGNKAVVADTAAGTNEPEMLAAFCGDCHNKNVNWDRGGSGNEGDVVTGGVSQGERPNAFAHPLGELDGLIDIYGKLGKVVSDEHIEHHVEMNGGMSCDDCHESRRGEMGEYNPSRFPHQSAGHKLLNNEYTDTLAAQTLDAGDPNRVLPNLDEVVCRECHGAFADEEEGIDFAGIGDPTRSDSF